MTVSPQQRCTTDADERSGELREVVDWIRGKRKLLIEIQENELFQSLNRALDIIMHYASRKKQPEALSDYQQMSADMTELAALNVWLGALLGQLETSEKQAEWMRKKKKAQLCETLDKAKASGAIEGTLTHARKDMIVELDPSYQNYQQVVLEAYRVNKIIRYTQEAIREMIQVLKINLKLGVEANEKLASL